MATLLTRSLTQNSVNKWGLWSFRNIRHLRHNDWHIAGFIDSACNICNRNLAGASFAAYSDHSGLSWKRPEGPPRIWRVFEGREKSGNVTKPRFTIQDVPEDMVDDTIEFMLKYLFHEETFTLTLGVAKDPLAVDEFRRQWKRAMRQGISIVTLAENNEDPTAKPVIAGANILNVVTALDKAKNLDIDQFKSIPAKKFWRMMFDLEGKVDVLAKYGVDKYLGSIGLLVHPSYRGYGIGAKMLQVREEIGRTYGIEVSEAMFTMKSSQISAHRAGFVLEYEKRYSEILDYEGNPVFPEMTDKFIHVMTKRLC